MRRDCARENEFHPVSTNQPGIAPIMGRQTVADKQEVLAL